MHEMSSSVSRGRPAVHLLGAIASWAAGQPLRYSATSPLGHEESSTAMHEHPGHGGLCPRTGRAPLVCGFPGSTLDHTATQGILPTPVGHRHLHVKLTGRFHGGRGGKANSCQCPLGLVKSVGLTGDRKLQRPGEGGEDLTCLHQPTRSFCNWKGGGSLIKLPSVSFDRLPCPSLKTLASPGCGCLTDTLQTQLCWRLDHCTMVSRGN